MTWTIQASLQPDESISSWLARAALLQGCDPLILTGAVWPSLRVWSIDIDRGMDRDHLQVLSRVSGISVAHFEQAALRTDAESIAGRPLTDGEAWPWVLTLGTRNRRRHGGQQFCSLCLASDRHPYFRRPWRFAWSVACPLHKICLIDRCSTCEAPIAPHRLVAEDRELAFCSHCHVDLRKAQTTPAPNNALACQRAAAEVMKIGTGVYGDQILPMAEWFATARFYTTLTRRIARRQASKLTAAIHSLGVDTNASNLPLTGLSLEQLSNAERTPLLGIAHHLMTTRPDTLHAALMRHAVTATATYDYRSPLPVPLKYLFSSLPGNRRTTTNPRQPRAPHPRTEKAVKGAWARLQRKAKAR